MHKEVITYKREDGIELSGTLYLPLGYDQEKKKSSSDYVGLSCGVQG